MHSAWMMQVAERLGALQATVSVGFHEVHRRMDDRDRFTAERHRETTGNIRRLDRRLDKMSSNGGHRLYTKTAVLLGMIILGALGHMAPEAVRAAISAMIPSLVKALLAG